MNAVSDCCPISPGTAYRLCRSPLVQVLQRIPDVCEDRIRLRDRFAEFDRKTTAPAFDFGLLQHVCGLAL